MKMKQTAKLKGEFKVAIQSRAARGAIMTLAPGASSDEQLSNEHPASEQWLFVISGSGVAEGRLPGKQTRRVALRPGTLLAIERGELHQITNSGAEPLRTVNLYVPPAYGADGTPRKRK